MQKISNPANGTEGGLAAAPVYLTTNDVALRLQRTQQTVAVMLRGGGLHGVRPAGSRGWLIEEQCLKAWIAEEPCPHAEKREPLKLSRAS